MQPERVFVDTNVLISGLVYKGNESELIRSALAGSIRLLIAEVVLFETRRVMAYKFAPHLPRLDAFLEKANYESVPEAGPQLISAAAKLVRDPDDVPILASILLSKPDVALTGDKDLLTDEIRAIAPVCTCAEYLQRLETR